MSDAPKTPLHELRIDRSTARPGSRWPWVIGLALLLSLTAGSFYFLRPDARSTPVAVAPVLEETSTGASASGATVLNASGYVTARRRATVSAKTTGRIVEVLIEEGLEVREDQILARLDDANAQRILRLAEAQTKASQSALAETRVRILEAQREFERVAKLVENRIATGADFDKADAAVRSLQARLEQQEAEISVTQAQAALYRQQLDDLIIRAPFAGIVVSKDAQPGEMISPMSAGGAFTRTGICTIVDMTSREIEVDVNEAFINRVQPGQPAAAVLDAYPEWTIPCKVIAIIPTADRQKATVKVRIGFDALDPRVLPDMGIKVAFQQGSPMPGAAAAPRRWTLPASAIRTANGQDVVWVVQDRRVSRRPVRVKTRENDRVSIDSGVAAGEQVVVAPPDTLQEGQKVSILQP